MNKILLILSLFLTSCEEKKYIVEQATVTSVHRNKLNEDYVTYKTATTRDSWFIQVPRGKRFTYNVGDTFEIRRNPRTNNDVSFKDKQ